LEKYSFEMLTNVDKEINITFRAASSCSALASTFSLNLEKEKSVVLHSSKKLNRIRVEICVFTSNICPLLFQFCLCRSLISYRFYQLRQSPSQIIVNITRLKFDLNPTVSFAAKMNTVCISSRFMVTNVHYSFRAALAISVAF
jgi:hypothetical protein